MDSEELSKIEKFSIIFVPIFLLIIGHFIDEYLSFSISEDIRFSSRKFKRHIRKFKRKYNKTESILFSLMMISSLIFSIFSLEDVYKFPKENLLKGSKSYKYIKSINKEKFKKNRFLKIVPNISRKYQRE